MTTRQILPFGDPLLRKKAKPVVDFNERTAKILDDMVETLYAAEGRAGLAAPQIGILRRIVVMDCGEGLIELMNPVITEMDGEQIGGEGCLSFPGYFGNVKRAHRVKVECFDRRGEPVVLEGEGFLARCLQHEIDHLDGVLYIDHVKDRWLYHEKSKRRIDLWEVIRRTNRS